MRNESSPIWYRWALAEVGVRETPGPKSTPRIMAYREIGKTPLGGEDGAVPWCAIFVNAALEAAGVRSTRSGMARSYERSPGFVKLAGPALGAITCKWRNSPKSGLGHVGFYAGHDTRGRVVLIGGNQGDSVSKASFDPGQITGFFWPKGQPLPAIGKVAAGSAVASATEV